MDRPSADQQHITEQIENERNEPANVDGDGVANHLKGFLNAGFGLIQGLGLTLRHLFRPPVTLQYPEERWEVPEGYRYIPVLVTDPITHELKCVGCGACARACPPQVIHIETSRVRDGGEGGKAKKKLNIDEFSVDMSRCMQCNLCVEACPFDALAMSAFYELADYELEGLVLDKEELVNLYENTKTAMIRSGHSWKPVGSDSGE